MAATFQLKGRQYQKLARTETVTVRGAPMK
jgi:hypothetical protein